MYSLEVSKICDIPSPSCLGVGCWVEAVDTSSINMVNFMENLPVEVRRVIYKKLDNKSLLNYRLVNSTTQEDIDANVEYNLKIDLDDISHIMLTRLGKLRARSLKFYTKDRIVNQIAIGGQQEDESDDDEEPSLTWLGWNFQSKFPDLVKVLEIEGAKCGICIKETFLLELLHKFQNLETLRIVNQWLTDHLSGEADLMKAVEVVKKLKGLQVLETKSVGAGAERFRFPLLSILLTNLNSRALKSVDINHFIVSTVPDSELELLRAPWSTIFKFILRHWESIRELTLKIVSLKEADIEVQKEDWSWMGSLDDKDKWSGNLKKIQTLKQFSFQIAKFGRDRSLRGPNQVTQILSELMKQQKELEIFEWDGGETLTPPILNHILGCNNNSLRVICITNLGKWDPERIHGILDMTTFVPCHHLKKLELKTNSLIAIPADQVPQSQLRFPFTLRNLDQTPVGLEELVIRGFWIEGDPIVQLRRLFEVTSILRSFEVGLECLVNTRGLTQVLMDGIQNVVTLETIKVRIRKRLNVPQPDPELELGVVEEEDDGWDEERLILDHMFGTVFSSFEEVYSLQTENGELLGDDFDPEEDAPFFELWEWTAKDIGAAERMKIITERANLLEIAND